MFRTFSDEFSFYPNRFYFLGPFEFNPKIVSCEILDQSIELIIAILCFVAKEFPKENGSRQPDLSGVMVVRFCRFVILLRV